MASSFATTSTSVPVESLPPCQKKKSPLLHDYDEINQSVQHHSSKLLVCGICYDGKSVCDMFKVGNCKHLFCNHCISRHVASQIHQNILTVMCPNPNCSVELKPKSFYTLLPREVIVRWECAKFESLTVGWEKTYCPFKDCAVVLVNDGGKVVTIAECPSCHRLFCAQCKVPWHQTMSCNEFQDLQRNKDEKEFFKLDKEKNTPQKRHRDKRCEHMTCKQPRLA